MTKDPAPNASGTPTPNNHALPLSGVRLSDLIWDVKYRLRLPSGKPLEATLDESLNRVTRWFGDGPQGLPRHLISALHDGVTSKKLLLSGRIMASAGAKLKHTLASTFAYQLPPSGWFSPVLRSLQHGGGVGCDLSLLPPGSVLSTIQRLSEAVRPLSRTASRQPAILIMLRVDHPDVFDFIEIHEKLGRLPHFNYALLLSDSYMNALREGSQVTLHYGRTHLKKVFARTIFERLATGLQQHGDPGILFIDTIRRNHPAGYYEHPIGTGSCGDQPMPSYGSTLFACINLSRLIHSPFTTDASLNVSEVEQLVALAVTTLNSALDRTSFPMIRQRRLALGSRRIAVGVTGLADALAMCGARYGSALSIELVRTWLAIIREASYRASVELARENGPFPSFDRRMHSRHLEVWGMPQSLIRAVDRSGLRNATLNAIPPAASISLLAENTSSGIEPPFYLTEDRLVTTHEGQTWLTITNFALSEYKKQHPERTNFPDTFVNTSCLTPVDHLNVLSAAQEFVDGSIAKTINTPYLPPISEYRALIVDAHSRGCKGCTFFATSPNLQGVVRQSEAIASG